MIDKLIQILTFQVDKSKAVPTPWNSEPPTVKPKVVLHVEQDVEPEYQKKVSRSGHVHYQKDTKDGFEAKYKLSVSLESVNVELLKQRGLSVDKFRELLPDLSNYDKWSDVISKWHGKLGERRLEQYRSAFNYMRMHPLPQTKPG